MKRARVLADCLSMHAPMLGMMMSAVLRLLGSACTMVLPLPFFLPLLTQDGVCE